MILSKAFYLRTDVVQIARELLGKTLVSDLGGHRTEGMIVETEAYKGPEDRGSHAYLNRRTKRTSTMFRAGGICYVYLCYGIHHMFNVVTGPEDMAHAILIRAVQPMEGMDIMKERRKIKGSEHDLTNGPGKFTIAMNIKTAHDGRNLHTGDSPLFIRNSIKDIPGDEIISSPRVGIGYAGEWAHRPWRFRIKNSNWTSKPDHVIYD